MHAKLVEYNTYFKIWLNTKKSFLVESLNFMNKKSLNPKFFEALCRTWMLSCLKTYYIWVMAGLHPYKIFHQ